MLHLLNELKFGGNYRESREFVYRLHESNYFVVLTENVSDKRKNGIIF